MNSIKEKIKTIGKAWRNILLEDKEFHDLYRERLAICNNCEKNILWICIACGCPIKSKTRSRYVDSDGDITECPLSKWKDSYHEDQNGNLFVIKANLPENLQEYFEEEYIKKEDWVEFLKEKNEE